MEPHQLIVIAVLLALGSMLQSAAGFGFALFSVPMLLLIGCQSFEAIAIVSVSAAAQAVLGVTLLRRHVHWPRILAMIALAGLGVPLGVAVLGMLADQDRAVVRRVFGGIVLVALALPLVMRVQPRDSLPRGAMVGAMLASGFMGGLSGMGGPPAVIWVMAHKWSNQESRATLWSLFAGMMPVQLLLLWREFGAEVGSAAILGVLMVPATLLGAFPGLWIGHRIPKPRLRLISLLLLAAIALYALLRP
jgi:uncharacterized membrane protein YfcA